MIEEDIWCQVPVSKHVVTLIWTWYLHRSITHRFLMCNLLISRHTWPCPLGTWQSVSPLCAWKTVPCPLKCRTLPTSLLPLPLPLCISLSLLPPFLPPPLPFSFSFHLFLFPQGCCVLPFSLHSHFPSPNKTPHFSYLCIVCLSLTYCGLRFILVPYQNTTTMKLAESRNVAYYPAI